MFQVQMVRKIKAVLGKYWSQQEERMQVQNGTEPDIRRSKRSL